MRMRSTITLLCMVVCVASIVTAQNSPAQQDPELASIVTYFDAMEKYRQGKIDEALASLKRALRVFERTGFSKGVFMTYLALSRIYRNQADYSRALDELKKANQRAKQERNAKWQALVLLRMGEVESYRSQFDDAAAAYEKSLEILKRMQEVKLSTIVKTRLAKIHIIRGNYKKAESLLNQAIKLAMDAGYLRDAAYALAQLGEIQRLIDNYSKSIAFLDKAQKVARECRVRFVEQEVLVQKAATLADQGSLSEAERLLRVAVGFFKSVSDLRRAAIAESMLGKITLRRGRIPEANNELEHAARDFDKLGDPYRKAGVLVDRARLLTVTGDLREAEKLLGDALKTYIADKSPYGEMNARVALTLLAVKQGRLMTAAENAKRALRLAADVQSRRGQANALLAHARVFRAMGEDAAALAKIAPALSLYRALDDEKGQVACLTAEADSLIGLGFLDRAHRSISAVSRFPRIGEDASVKGNMHLLAGRIAQAQGDESGAHVEYRKASALLAPLALPFKKAALLESMAETEERSRRLMKALSLWERAEGLYDAANSPIGILRCRSARARLDLDLGDVSQSESIARQNLRITDDAKFLKLYQDVVKAQVAVASGDTQSAERILKKSLTAAGGLKIADLTALLNEVMAQAYADQGNHGKALESLKKAGTSKGWRFDHYKAMLLIEEGKVSNAVPLLKRAVGELLALEEEVGVWQVSPRLMRDRTAVFEDYLDALMTVSAASSSQEAALETWDAAQRLKMRRVFYDLASVGAMGFPGITRSVLQKAKSLQYRSIISMKRNEHLSLAKTLPSDTRQNQAMSAPDKPQKISKFFDDLGEKHPRYVTFLRADPPSVEQIRSTLNGGDAYVSFVVTRKKLHAFLVTKDSFKSATATGPVADIRKTLDTIRSNVAKPYYLEVDTSMNEMWNLLFGSLLPEMGAAKHLVVETDAFLTLFPFEALAHEVLPESYRERQAAPLLLDKYTIVRTTSAFRYLGQRKRAESKVVPSLEAYVNPELPNNSGSLGQRSSADNALDYWKRAISQYASSAYFRKPDQGIELRRLFGKNGNLLDGEKATRTAFLKRDPAEYSMVHLMCPVLMPAIPAGKVQQPLFVFSPEGGDTASSFCGVDHLLEEYDPAELLTIIWLGSDKADPCRGATLLLETLGFAGVRHVVLPLWPTDSQGEDETSQFMIRFYKSLMAGNDVTKAFGKAREALMPTSSRKNRCNPARFALY